MSDALGLAIIAAVAGIIGPAATAVVAYIILAKKQKADYARQDAVALATELVASRLAHSTQVTSAKLDTIHNLVNNAMTIQIRAELSRAEENLSLLLRILALNSAAGREQSADDRAAIDASRIKIAELQKKIKERIAQDERQSGAA